jgi:hypothetical protein
MLEPLALTTISIDGDAVLTGTPPIPVIPAEADQLEKE